MRSLKEQKRSKKKNLEHFRQKQTLLFVFQEEWITAHTHYPFTVLLIWPYKYFSVEILDHEIVNHS